MAKLKQVNLIAANLDETMGFYRRLGLDVPEADVWRTESGPHHANASPAEVDLEFDSRRLAQVYNRGFQAERGRVMIGVEVESRDAVDRLWSELLAAGCQGLQPPYDAFWGSRYAIVEDPDGNPVGLASPMDPDLCSAPPNI